MVWITSCASFFLTDSSKSSGFTFAETEHDILCHLFIFFTLIVHYILRVVCTIYHVLFCFLYLVTFPYLAAFTHHGQFWFPAHIVNTVSYPLSGDCTAWYFYQPLPYWHPFSWYVPVRYADSSYHHFHFMGKSSCGQLQRIYVWPGILYQRKRPLLHLHD